MNLFDLLKIKINLQQPSREPQTVKFSQVLEQQREGSQSKPPLDKGKNNKANIDRKLRTRIWYVLQFKSRKTEKTQMKIRIQIYQRTHLSNHRFSKIKNMQLFQMRSLVAQCQVFQNHHTLRNHKVHSKRSQILQLIINFLTCTFLKMLKTLIY